MLAKTTTTNTNQARARHHNLPTNPPTTDQLLSLPLAEGGTYLLTEQEIQTLRSRLYNLNANNVRGWKWRTTRLFRTKDRSVLLVWRVD